MENLARAPCCYFDDSHGRRMRRSQTATGADRQCGPWRRVGAGPPRLLCASGAAKGPPALLPSRVSHRIVSFSRTNLRRCHDHRSQAIKKATQIGISGTSAGGSSRPPAAHVSTSRQEHRAFKAGRRFAIGDSAVQVTITQPSQQRLATTLTNLVGAGHSHTRVVNSYARLHAGLLQHAVCVRRRGRYVGRPCLNHVTFANGKVLSEIPNAGVARAMDADANPSRPYFVRGTSIVWPLDGHCSAGDIEGSLSDLAPYVVSLNGRWAAVNRHGHVQPAGGDPGEDPNLTLA